MSVVGGPRLGIVREGLVLNLDAGNTLSYPGTGTDWFDLTGNGNNGTLTNGVTYLTDNGGIMSFDGINDFVSIPNSDSLNTISVSVSMWIKFNLLSNDKVLFSKGAGGSRTYWFYENGGIQFFYGAATPKILKTDLEDGNWHNIVGTYNGTSTISLYHNGVLFGTSNSNSQAQTTQNLSINSYPGGSYVASDKKIGNTLIYNRALTDSEVLQNYNATKGRFGL